MYLSKMPKGIALVCLVLMSDRNSSTPERKFLCDLILALAGKNDPIIAMELENCGIYDLETAERKVFELIKEITDELQKQAGEFPRESNYLDVLILLAEDFVSFLDEPYFRFWFGISLYASAVDNKDDELALRLAKYEAIFLQMLYKVGPAAGRLDYKKYCSLAKKHVSKKLG